AGEGYGARFLPRIGEVVVIDFFDGNIDRPFVTGRIHEAQRSPTKFDIKGQLPDTKKLSGIRSQEVNGGGFNQLRFDDTTGQISTQLQSSHAATQLNLGNLSHPKIQETSNGRGEGFELRTDAWGAVRAGKGMLISTYAQEQAIADHLEAQSVKQQLQSSQGNAKALSEVAKNQQTDEIESLEQLKEFAAGIEEKIAKFNKAMLLLSSQNGIGLSSDEDIHISADGQINQTASGSINLSSQKNLIAHIQNKISWFAAENGIKQVAAKGKFEMHAQSDGIDFFAKRAIQVISTEDKIYITSPKEISFTADGSALKINESGIFLITSGKFEVKAGQHKFKAGQQVKVEVPTLPIVDEMKTFTNKWDFYDLFYESNFSEVKYKLINNKNNSYVSGTLDAHGRTQRINTFNNDDHDILIGTDGDWTVSLDDGIEVENFEYNCSCSHEDHLDQEEI
ncbi:MAG: DUF2345 domain-containing protein, partial [Pseudomonadota bacterium]|nr:DUF2345 domain-containing protein [Pseudomonadota bacterium]